MVRWFCPYCWKEVDERDRICPYCGSDLSKFSTLDYEEKLILALDSPITQNRVFAIEVLGKKKVKKAVDKLCKMLFEERDTLELIEIAIALFDIGSKKAFECLNERSKIKDNKLLNKTLEKFLDRINGQSLV
jgi:hypothetical protein